MVSLQAITAGYVLTAAMAEGIITALEVQKRNKRRVNIYLDETFAFSLALEEAALLRKGQALSAEDVAALQAADALARAVDSAARFLALRPRSTHEVRENLARKAVAPAVVELAIERLSALGYLDDAAFAEFWVRERNQSKPLSPRALRYELRQKGVADDLIEAALAQVDAQDAAYRAAAAQARRLRGSDRAAFRSKLFAHLARRGFDYETARTTIRQLLETLEHEDASFFAERQPDLPDEDDMRSEPS